MENNAKYGTPQTAVKETKVVSEHNLKIGAAFAMLRKKAGFTNMESFAYMNEIPRAQYARWEKGTNITVDSVFRVLHYHKITLAQFAEIAGI